MRTKITKQRMEKEGLSSLPALSFPGGYPIVYFEDANVLCAECATTAVNEGKTVSHECHMEGAPIECTECNHEIESAYGSEEAA